MIACRNIWPDSGASGSGADGEYVNLKNLSTVSNFWSLRWTRRCSALPRSVWHCWRRWLAFLLLIPPLLCL